MELDDCLRLTVLNDITYTVHVIIHLPHNPLPIYSLTPESHPPNSIPTIPIRHQSNKLQSVPSISSFTHTKTTSVISIHSQPLTSERMSYQFSSCSRMYVKKTRYIANPLFPAPVPAAKMTFVYMTYDVASYIYIRSIHSKKPTSPAFPSLQLKML